MPKLLACDLDGTLFFPKGKKRCISKKNVKFLQDFIDEGNKVVLVTSRSTQFTDKLKDEIQRDLYEIETILKDKINIIDKRKYGRANLIFLSLNDKEDWFCVQGYNT